MILELNIAKSDLAAMSKLYRKENINYLNRPSVK